MEDSPVFVIEFFTKSVGPSIVAWSYDMKLANLFIKQHGFDENNIKEYVIPGYDIKNHNDIIQPDTMIELHKMKSNSSDTIHNIATTDELLDNVTRSLADDLVDYLMFGEIIIRTDLKFIDNISDCIEKLEYASICDFDLIANDVVDRYYDEDYSLGVSQYPRFPPPADTSYIYDTLFHARSNHDILPFTVEAYVHYFISQIMEET